MFQSQSVSALISGVFLLCCWSSAPAQGTPGDLYIQPEFPVLRDLSQDDVIETTHEGDRPDTSAPTQRRILTPRFAIGAGPVLYSYKYKEPGLMKETGIYYGLAPYLNYEGKVWRWRIEARFPVKGTVDYDGFYADEDGDVFPLEINGVDDRMDELRFVAGWIGRMQNGSTIVPYTGFGLRHLSDDLSIDPFGYRRESSYTFSPFGLEFKSPLGDQGWSLVLGGEYDYFWGGTQKSFLSDVGDSPYELPDVENDQNDGHGLKGSVAFSRSFPAGELVMEAFVQVWDISTSEFIQMTVCTRPDVFPSDCQEVIFFEPANKTTEIGVILRFNVALIE